MISEDQVGKLEKHELEVVEIHIPFGCHSGIYAEVPAYIGTSTVDTRIGPGSTTHRTA
ncbi:hypothetical protein SCHPADRAFT_908595 [Schizopora paradoxa]|uniref:Uncharacterized protein n=1 Tax=Schizopora paradoxa TaxID=27342 RepID=A0A0H2RG31_9AGAM|nr:hypothetical protein SCHPADRAFT_908595 [Schizopora paradoxa]